MKHLSKSLIIGVGVMCLCSCFISRNTAQSNALYQNYVPNQETAIKIAEAIWLPIYGEEIYDYTPFVAKLNVSGKKDSIWHVEGTSPYKLGGVPTINIQKSNCKILLVKWPK